LPMEGKDQIASGTNIKRGEKRRKDESVDEGREISTFRDGDGRGLSIGRGKWGNLIAGSATSERGEDKEKKGTKGPSLTWEPLAEDRREAVDSWCCCGGSRITTYLFEILSNWRGEGKQMRSREPRCQK